MPMPLSTLGGVLGIIVTCFMPSSYGYFPMWARGSYNGAPSAFTSLNEI